MKSTFRTPLKDARGLGSAHTGLHPWWMQRMTALIVAALGLWFLAHLLGLLTGGYLALRIWMAQPVHTALMIVFMVGVFAHMALGLRVIVEDYVHHPKWAVFLQLAVMALAGLGGLASVLALLKMALEH